MKNKALFLLLTAALLLTGCTAKSAEPSSSPAPTATAEPTDTPAPTAEPTPTPEPTSAPPDLSELPGTVEKRVYSNRYFSIGCELEPNWTYYSPAQIEELTDMARRSMDESGAAAFDEALSPDGAVYCMAAAANKLNLNMAVQKAGGSDPYTVLTEAAEELTDALKGIGLAGAQTDTVTAVFAGEERPSLKVTGIANGRTMCILCTALEAWDYIAVITASAPSEEEAEGILACWYPLEER